METSELAPVVLFVYKRPEHTQKTISALAANSLAVQTKLYIVSDAAKSREDEAKVQEVRQFLRTVSGFQQVTVVEREKNFGLTTNILFGVSDIVAKHGRVIVLEDDIVVAPYFLSYMNLALERYHDDERVMAVSAYWWPEDRDDLPETFFVPWFNVWGWGTWARAWQNFTRDPQKTLRDFPRTEIPKLNIGSYYNLWNQVLANVNGTLNSWAIFFMLHIWQAHGLVLHPRHDLAMNIGFDGSGEHCNSYFTEKFKRTSLSDEQISDWPQKIEPCVAAIQGLQRWFKKKHEEGCVRAAQFVKFCREARRLYCYGAGKNGENIAHLLALHGMDIVAFVETSHRGSGELYGRPIYALDDVMLDECAEFIVAAQYKHQADMAAELSQRGITSYFLLREDMWEFLRDSDGHIWQNA